MRTPITDLIGLKVCWGSGNMIKLETDFVVVRRCLPSQGNVVYSIENRNNSTTLAVLHNDIYCSRPISNTDIKFTINMNSLLYRATHELMPGINFGTGPEGFCEKVFYFSKGVPAINLGKHSHNMYFDMYLSNDIILKRIVDFEKRNYL